MPAGRVGRLTTKATFAALQRSRRRGRCGPVHAVFVPAPEKSSDAFPRSGSVTRSGNGAARRSSATPCGAGCGRSHGPRLLRCRVAVICSVCPPRPDRRSAPASGRTLALRCAGRPTPMPVPVAVLAAAVGADAGARREPRSGSRGCGHDRRIDPDGPDRSRTGFVSAGRARPARRRPGAGPPGPRRRAAVVGPGRPSGGRAERHSPCSGPIRVARRVECRLVASTPVVRTTPSRRSKSMDSGARPP